MAQRSRTLLQRRQGHEHGRHLSAAPSRLPRRRGGLVDRVLDLQASAGNRATTEVLHGRLGGIVSANGLHRGRSKGDAGSLPSIELDPSHVREKDPDGEGKADTVAPGRAASEARSSSGPADGISLAPMVDVDVATPEVDDPERRKDSRDDDTLEPTAIGTTWTNPGTKTVKPFGSESFGATASNITWQVPGAVERLRELFGDQAPPMKLQLTLDVSCPWGTNGGANTDVGSGTDPAVTARTYRKIAKDLTPEKVEKSWVAPRSKYWSKAICSRHEKFHSTDDKAWAETKGKQILADYLRTQKVSPDAPLTGISSAISRGIARVSNENFAFYKGGAGSYYSYAGEERAFGDGKQPYLDLVKKVRTQGHKLKAAAEAKKAT